MRSRHVARHILAVVSAVVLVAGPAGALEVGQMAPPFTLTAPGGKPVSLTDLIARGPVVIYTFIQVANGV